MAARQVTSSLESYGKLIADYLAKIKEGTLSCADELTKTVDDTILIVQSDRDVNLTRVAAILDSLKEITRYLTNENEILSKKVKKLEEELETMKVSLIIGQIAFKLEKEIKRLIFEDTRVERRNYMFLNLDEIERAVNDECLYAYHGKSKFKLFISDEERRRAKEKWEELLMTYKIDYPMLCAIKELKHQRNIKAHPKETITQAREFLQTHIRNDDDDQKMSFELLEILNQMGITNIET